jgi:hypothetical protein
MMATANGDESRLRASGRAEGRYKGRPEDIAAAGSGFPGPDGVTCHEVVLGQAEVIQLRGHRFRIRIAIFLADRDRVVSDRVD